MDKTIAYAAIAGLMLAGSALAQSQPPVGEAPAAGAEAPTHPATPPTGADRKKDGSESGWGGQQKTKDEQKADPNRNEAQGQPPR